MVVGIRFRMEVEPRPVDCRPGPDKTVDQRPGHGAAGIACDRVVAVMVLRHEAAADAFHERPPGRIASQQPMHLVFGDFSAGRYPQSGRQEPGDGCLETISSFRRRTSR